MNPRIREDVAECVALGVSLGDPQPDEALALAREFGLVDRDGRLTAAGWQAAGEAIGFDPEDHHG